MSQHAQTQDEIIGVNGQGYAQEVFIDQLDLLYQRLRDTCACPSQHLRGDVH
jgi:hypothetical protein